MDRWQGYLPVSSASLLATFERAAQSGVQFSLAEDRVDELITRTAKNLGLGSLSNGDGSTRRQGF